MTGDLATRPTALVVDDIDDARSVLRRMLELRGCCVLKAADGGAASHSRPTEGRRK